MSFLVYQFRRFGPHFGLATGVIFSSYITAIYLDSKKKNLNFRFGQLINLKGNLNERLSTSDDLIGRFKLFWKQSRESQKTIYLLIAANTLVYFSWKFPMFSNYMNRFFLHSIRSHPLSMIGSIFSHKSLMHLGFNMLALNSFGVFLSEKMGREQFLAFYLSAGTFSSLASHVYKGLKFNFTPSLGASGAIFGVVGGCAHFPELKVSLIFLPIHSVPINLALPAMMGVDALGMLMNWKMFDHCAHLAGSLFGYTFYSFSQNYVWNNRKKISNFLNIK